MKIKMSFAVASLLALAVSSQAFAQDNATNPSAAMTPTAQSAQSQTAQDDCNKAENKNRDDCKKAAYVPGAKAATTQSTGDLIPYAVAIGVVVLIAVASSGGGHKSGNTGTN